MKWEKEKLGEICEILDNKRKPISKNKRIAGEYPYYGATGIVDYVNDYIFDERLVLVGEDGAKWCSGDNTAFIVEGKVWVNNHAHVLKPKNNLIDSYLVYYLNHQDLSDYITGLTVPKLNQEKLRSIPIPLPSLEEQQTIVAKLDQAFAAIDQAKANIEKNIANAKELFQSKLNQIFSQKGDDFGYDKHKLGNLGIITSSKRIYKSEYVKEGIPFYRTKEIKELANDKEISLELFISEEKYLEIKEKFGVPKIGDILMSAVGTIGEILVIENENRFYFKDGNIVWFKDFNDVNSFYLKYLLRTFVENLKSLAKGAAYSALTIEKIKEYEVYIPNTLEEQQKIVTQLDQLQEQTNLLVTKYQQKLANLEELKKSILEKAFKGELSTTVIEKV